MNIVILHIKILNKKLNARHLVIGLFLLINLHISAQQSLVSCNKKTPWINTPFTVSESHSDSLQSFWQNGASSPAALIDASLSNYARAHIKSTGWVKVKVADTNPLVIYNAGDYAGFLIESKAFHGGHFSSVTIHTYLNETLRETYTGQDMIGLGASFLSGPVAVGFITTLSFNRVELIIDGSLGSELYDVYYVLLQKYCEGAIPDCNVLTAMENPAYPAIIDYTKTGSDSLSAGYVDNPESVLTISGVDFASLVHVSNVQGNTFLAVKQQASSIPVGSFVGFDIQNLNIAGTGLLTYLTITTYLNGVVVESKTGNNLLINRSMSTIAGRQTIGFVTTTTADEVRLTIHQNLSTNLGTTRVYSDVLQKPCAGDALTCNMLQQLRTPSHPVVIDGQHTGITGNSCSLCSVQSAGNAIDQDSTNYASITVTSGSSSQGSLAVKDLLSDYPAGTFAGYQLENTALIGANLFSGVTISTYLNGTLKESKTGSSALLSVGSNLLVNPGQHIIGFVTTLPFDEVKVTLQNAGSFNIGSTKVYNVIAELLCSGAPVSCDSTFWLMSPQYPVLINTMRTGISGATCNTCSVIHETFITTTDTTDYARITIIAGSPASGSISLINPVSTYPQGTIAGFAIEDVNGLLQADLFNSITISTYNNGTLQESATGSHLDDIAVSIEWNIGTGTYNVGFTTTLPFDEVRITLRSLPSVNNIINVYGAFIDTRTSVIGGVSCLAILAVNWLSFDAVKTDAVVELTWSTNQEINNAGFQVERSTSAGHFEIIGEVLPAQKRDGINHYSFTDHHPVSGINYYRIKQVDYDGSFDYTNILLVSFNTHSTEIKMWPNPVSEQLTIDLGSKAGQGEIRMISATGAIVYRGSFAENDQAATIDVSTLAEGMYTLIIETPNAQHVEKIIVLR